MHMATIEPAKAPGTYSRLRDLPRNVWAVSLTSFVKLFSGWLSNKVRERKWLAVLGYAMSALALIAALLMQFWTPAAYDACVRQRVAPASRN
jgi:hypothetical protein